MTASELIACKRTRRLPFDMRLRRLIAFLSAPVATLERAAKSVAELIGQLAKDNRPVSNWLQEIVDESLKKKDKY
jgi:hypothetical protein